MEFHFQNEFGSEASTSLARKISDRSYSCPNQDMIVDLDDLEHSLEECDEDVLDDDYSYRLYAISVSHEAGYCAYDIVF